VLKKGGACRRNLRVVQGVTVTRIVSRGGAATGVLIRASSPEGANAEPRNQRTRFVRARHEVISCAGPYGSPKLLQLSGIGLAALCTSMACRWCTTSPSARTRRPGCFLPQFTRTLACRSRARTVQRCSMRPARTRGLRRHGGVWGISYAAANDVFKAQDTVHGVAFALPAGKGLGSPLILDYCDLNLLRAALLASRARTRTPAAVFPNLLGAPGVAERATACVTRLAQATKKYPSPFVIPPVCLARLYAWPSSRSHYL
jgi:GMC oxidoreductase